MASKGVESLSAKQLQCLELVAQGYTSAEIEGRLGISANTVNTHIALAVRKLDAPNRLHAARMLRDYRAAGGQPATPPENLASEILRLSPTPPTSPDSARQGASPSEDMGLMLLSPIEPPRAPPEGRRSNHDLTAGLKTAVLIIAIAAGLTIVLANYPSLVRGAKDIYNAMPPTSITAH